MKEYIAILEAHGLFKACYIIKALNKLQAVRKAGQLAKELKVEVLSVEEGHN